jgi:hypothetical protein
MDPKLWGPHTWKTLHALAIEADRRKTTGEFQQFMKSLSSLLPCEACRGHMESYLAMNPVPNENVFVYSVQFHNHVNKRLGKREVSYEEALEMWHTSACSKCEPEKQNENYFPLGILVLSIIILICLWNYVTPSWKKS